METGASRELPGALGAAACAQSQRAAQAIYMVDSKGLITTSRGDKLPSHKKMMARSDDTPNMKDLREIIEYVKPHALIGLSGAGPMFKQARPGHAKALSIADCLGTRQPAWMFLRVLVMVSSCRQSKTLRQQAM